MRLPHSAAEKQKNFLGVQDLSDKYVSDDFSVDAILSDVKKYTGGDTGEMKTWSLEEIDRLLAEDGGNETPPMPKPAPILPEGAPKSASEEIREALPSADKPLIEVPEEAEEIKAEAPEKAPEAETLPGQISIEKTRVFNEVHADVTRREGVSHSIGQRVIRTTTSEFAPIAHKPTMETDKYRQRFLDRRQLEMEKTRDHLARIASQPQMKIEKPGVIVKNNGTETDEDGLSPVPTILSVEDEFQHLNGERMETQSGELQSGLADQIMLEGFAAEEAAGEQIDEAEAELDLLHRRREKAGSFRLFPNLETAQKTQEHTRVMPNLSETQADSGEQLELEPEEAPKKRRTLLEPERLRIPRDYCEPKDKTAIFQMLQGDKRRAGLCAAALALIFCLEALFAYLLGSGDGLSFFGGSEMLYIALHLVLTLIAGGICFKQLKSGVVHLLSGTVNSSTGALVGLLVGFLQIVVAFFYPESVESDTHLYAALCILPMFMNCVGEYLKLKGDIHNFECLSSQNGALYGVAKVENESDAFEIGRGLLLGDPDIRYSAELSFAHRFVEMSRLSDTTGSANRSALPAVLAAGAVTGIITGVLTRAAFPAVTAMTGVVLMGIPMCSLLSSAWVLYRANKALLPDGSFLSGWHAVEDLVSTNAVAVDANDIFTGGGCNVYGIKTFRSMRIDEVLLYTAAMVISSGGALEEAFDGVIRQKRELLPPVESLVYEDKLGCSGWIYNHRVLVGSRDLLIKHNVEVSEIKFEERCKQKGRQVLYLAVDSKVSAMFAVGYSAAPDTAQYMKALEKCGVSLLVRTSDPNITEELIDSYFDLPHNFTKIVSPVSGKLLRDLREQVKTNESCGGVHDGRVNTLLHTVSAAFAADAGLKAVTILQYIGVGLGVLIMALLAFSSGLFQAGILQMTVFQLFWILLVFFVPMLKKY